MDFPHLGPWPEWIVASYEQLAGESLGAAGELYENPAVVLCHDTSPDPVFVFVNRAAQRLWERSWRHFVGMPSRLTAPPEARRERAGALAEQGLVRGYSGVRVSAGGRRFRIVGASIWPVFDSAGRRRGQAACFTEWQRVPVGQA